jgi:hypothetical protein
VALVAWLAFASPAPAAPAAAAPARLAGAFTMSGRVTVAKNVPGERVGQRVTRIWTFAPLCPTEPCTSVRLVRTRARGTDSLILHRRPGGRYTGRGRFYLPLGCAGRTYRPGERVPFTIVVRVTASAVLSGVLTATRVSATYVNRFRRNLTPCVAVLGHDAARYTGALTGPLT